MKKKIVAAILCMAMVVSAFGCSKKSTSNQEGFESEKFNLTIACQAEEGEKTVLEALKASYEKSHPDTNIVLTDFGAYGTVREYITAYASSQDKLPMVLWMPNDDFAEPAEGGYFVDLRSYYEASEETSYDLYYDSMLNSASYTGEYKPLSEDDSKEYGLWYAPRDYNKPTIVYNTKLMAELGIEIPDTSNGWGMPEFFAFCQQVNNTIEAKAQENRSYRGYRAIHLFSAWEPVYTTLFANMGSDGIIKDGTYNLSSAKNEAIMTELYDNLFQYEYMIDTDDAFNSGTVCMTVVSRPLVVGMANQMGKDSINFLPFPGEKVAAGCSGYGITTAHAEEEQTVNGETKKVADIAWDFIKYIISEEGQQVAGETGLSVPVLKSLLDTGTWREWNAEAKLNHDAFLAGDELIQDTYNSLKPSQRTRARSLACAYFSYAETMEGGKAENRKVKLEGIEKDFAASVK